jgi:chemotaxis signal transduction protein
MSDQALDEREAKLLLERAERLRNRKEAGDDDDGAWAAEFEMGSERYALPLERLRACLPLKGVAPVPLSRHGVVGITRWEGKVVAVFSLAILLGLRGWRRDPSVLLLLSRGDGFVGLDCEEIPRSSQLPFQALASAPPATGALRPLSLPQPGQASPRLVQWIDPDRLFETGQA